ncbi:MAG TPA: TorF family putative porin [Steroidobacteraceae bacterium]|nr:TorF family putative porin [Steroidobacteraceae bacterium]
MKRLSRTLLLVAVMAAPVSHAETSTVITGSLGGTSDFVFRGLSLTRGKPAAQASIDVEFPREFYVGAFVATCDPNPGPSPPVEADFWAGRYWRVSEDFSADLRLSQYTYPDDPRRVTYDRTEITGTLGFRNQLYFATIYSPNTKAVASSPGYEEGAAWALEISGRQPFNDRFALSAGFGHYALDEIYEDSYNYWNVTLTATLKPFEFQLAYLGVSDHAARHFARDAVGDRVAFTALWRFSNQ